MPIKCIGKSLLRVYPSFYFYRVWLQRIFTFLHYISLWWCITKVFMLKFACLALTRAWHGLRWAFLWTGSGYLQKKGALGRNTCSEGRNMVLCRRWPNCSWNQHPETSRAGMTAQSCPKWNGCRKPGCLFPGISQTLDLDCPHSAMRRDVTSGKTVPCSWASSQWGMQLPAAGDQCSQHLRDAHMGPGAGIWEKH